MSINEPIKIFIVHQENERDINDIKRMRSYVLAHSMADVAEEYKNDDPELDHRLIAIEEIGVVIRKIECKEHFPVTDEQDKSTYCHFCLEELE